MSVDGRTLAQAWNEWEESSEGQQCEEGVADGQFLRNRLWRAFMAGAKAAQAGMEK